MEQAEILEFIFSSSESDSDSTESSSSSSEDDILLCTDVREKIPRMEGYFENIVSQMSDGVFKSHFRLHIHTMERIENIVSESFQVQATGRPCVPLKKQLHMVIWYLATPECYRSISDRFGVCPKTLWNSVQKICAILVQKAPEIIKWPQSTELPIIQSEFKRMAGVPDVIGCIDGTHIPIKVPLEHPESYINRHSFASLVLQGVADNKLKFLDCYVGEVGCVHDARVFSKSFLGQNLRTKVPQPYHILGDKAYPLRSQLLTPFRDNGHLTASERNYNHLHSQTRCTVERAFGLLKGRFRRLKGIDMTEVVNIPAVIMACCVLHNICQGLNDETEEDDEPQPKEKATDDDEETYSISGVNKRLQIMQLLA
ncbi:putative nuclease HARBI1 [Uloborus diversus]|uniref:putative nuclease HARBI1 n=1 Tax=Uloborus diversus TaxID=327109 RepID=UPI002409FCF5|nr:putative nuclease HARBI1 [Uloborus diversus]